MSDNRKFGSTLSKVVRYVARNSLRLSNPFDASCHYYVDIDEHQRRLETDFRTDRTWLPRQVLLYHYFAILVVRYLLTAIAAADPSSTYFDYDFVSRLVMQQIKFDSNSFMLLAWAVNFGIIINVTRNHLVDWPICDAYHRVTVRNFDLFQRLKLAVDIPKIQIITKIDFRKSNMAKTFGQTVTLLVALRRNRAEILRVLNEQNLCRYYLHSGEISKLEPNSWQFKFDSLCMFLYAELANITFAILLKTLTNLTVLVYVKKFAFSRNSRLTAGQSIFLFFDRFALMTCAAQTIRVMLCEVFRVTIVSKVYGAKFELINRRLNEIQCRQRRLRGSGAKSQLNQVIFAAKICALQAQHYDLCAFVTRLNRRVISINIFGFLITNVPYNVYLLAKSLLSGRVDPMAIMLAGTQLIILCTAALPIVRLHSRSMRSRRALYAIQLRSPGGVSFDQKWRLLAFYERVIARGARNRIGFSCGPLGVITKQMLFKFLLIYAAYIMYSTTTIIESKKNN